MGDIVHLADISEPHRFSDPITFLKKVIEDIESGELKCPDGLCVLACDKSKPDVYHTRFRMHNIRCSEAVALLDVNKAKLLNILLGVV